MRGGSRTSHSHQPQAANAHPRTAPAGCVRSKFNFIHHYPGAGTNLNHQSIPGQHSLRGENSRDFALIDGRSIKPRPEIQPGASARQPGHAFRPRRPPARTQQFVTADAIYKQSVDLKNSGVAAGMDVLRAQVQLGARRQRLLATANDLQKQYLNLGRAIGLPPGQQFTLTDHMPQAPAQTVSLEQAIADAYNNRADYKRSQSLVRSADIARKAAAAQALPLLRFDGDYGVIGSGPSNSHGTFDAAIALQIPIFQGGRVRGEVHQAQALLNQRRAESDDLRGRIDAQVRAAYLDVQSAAQQLEVARTTVDLANQELAQARDRFAAGVSGSLEVTQAQEAVASANDDFINSLYSFNLSQASLARAAGVAEKSVKQFLGKP